MTSIENRIKMNIDRGACNIDRGACKTSSFKLNDPIISKLFLLVSHNMKIQNHTTHVLGNLSGLYKVFRVQCRCSKDVPLSNPRECLKLTKKKKKKNLSPNKYKYIKASWLSELLSEPCWQYLIVLGIVTYLFFCKRAQTGCHDIYPPQRVQTWWNGLSISEGKPISRCVTFNG